MKVHGHSDGWKEGPRGAQLPPLSAKLLVSMRTTQAACPRENAASFPPKSSLFLSPLFFKSMKGSVTGEVGTIVCFWLKGDSLSRGWHRQRDLGNTALIGSSEAALQSR